MIAQFKNRLPKLYSVAGLALALGLVGGIATYERRASAAESCCYPGAPCCHPGAACCAAHQHVGK